MRAGREPNAEKASPPVCGRTARRSCRLTWF